MFSGANYSKEVIRNSMLKHALSYWNIKNTEDLDPIVKLILEALANELFNLGNDIRDTEVRLLEKIANLLAPGFLTCPNPAHGMLHCTPVEAQEVLEETMHFYAQKKISSKQDETLDTSIDIFFTPVDKVRILNINVAHFATGNNLYTYDPLLNKQHVAYCRAGNRIENNVLWLGLTVDERLTDLRHLFFCFDWKNLTPEISNLNYQLLPLSKWSLNADGIATAPGIHYETKQESDILTRKLSSDYDVLSLIEKDIKDYYNRRFLTLVDERLADISTVQENYPTAFKNLFGEPDLQKLNRRLLWLKITFPAALPPGALDDVYVYVNTFPAMNRRLNELNCRLKGGSSIIPLKTVGPEQFLSVKSLSDENHQYKSAPFRKLEEEESGTYTLRKGGVERFDGRNAKEFISYLLELLRSESAAFSAYGNDFIASTLREMNQRIALMEQKTKSLANTPAEIPHYIIAKPYEGNEMMYVEYWATLAETANGLRSGTRLQEYNNVKLKPDSVFFLSTVTGGKNRLKPEERVNAFRYGLITRNRIVTKEDIRNFCFYELGDRISDVAVEKGFEMSVHPKQGFFRTIDILITPAAGEKLNREGWQVLFDQLLPRLQSRSGMSNNYRIKLKTV